MAKLNDMFPSKYIRASDLAGTKRSLTIAKVEMEDVAGDGEPKPVLYFRGAKKAMVLNKTNAMVIAASLGDETDDWSNCSITLIPSRTPFQGKVVDCIRVDVPPPAPRQAKAPPPADDEPLGSVQADDGIPF